MIHYNRLAIFGGTFSPVHNGHIKAMEAYANKVHPDVLYIIPTSIPPHKIRTDSATDRQRINMLRLIADELDVPCEVFVSDMEILRGGKSYTADTLLALQKLSNRVYMYCGTDMLLSLDTWYNPSIIMKIATVAYMQRESDLRLNESVEAKAKDLVERFNARLIKIPEVPFEVSSSEIREKIKRGESISHLVPKAVEEYIYREGLYV
ncbi:MAG: nicotinate (nicotinamide) nucleotide adenylyltransferase [Clostridia bacterium]|nr:nicotinate (nicotinamide) nucleotide adenylyltransferase [Clostridia bacterium]